MSTDQLPENHEPAPLLGLGLSEGLGAVSEARCICKDRALSACPGEWEPGCDLGNNVAHVRGGAQIQKLQADLAQVQAYAAALNARCVADAPDAERYRWLRDNPLWSVGYRVKPRTGFKEWRMRDEGDYWGNWWPTHEQAVDHAMALDSAIAAARATAAVGAA